MIWETIAGVYFFWSGLVTSAIFLILLVFRTKKEEMSGKVTGIFVLALLSWILTLTGSVMETKRGAIGIPVSFNAIRNGDGYIAREVKMIVLEKGDERRFVEGLPSSIPLDKPFSLKDGKPFILLQGGIAH